MKEILNPQKGEIARDATLKQRTHALTATDARVVSTRRDFMKWGARAFVGFLAGGAVMGAAACESPSHKEASDRPSQALENFSRALGDSEIDPFGIIFPTRPIRIRVRIVDADIDETFNLANPSGIRFNFPSKVKAGMEILFSSPDVPEAGELPDVVPEWTPGPKAPMVAGGTPNDPEEEDLDG